MRIFLIGIFFVGSMLGAAGAYYDDFRSASDDIKRIDADLKRLGQEEKLRRMEERALQHMQDIEQKRLRGEYETRFKFEQFGVQSQGTLDARVRQFVAGTKIRIISFGVAIVLLIGLAWFFHVLYGRKRHGDVAGRDSEHVLAQVNTWILRESDVRDLLTELAIVIPKSHLNVHSAVFRQCFIKDLVLIEVFFEMAFMEHSPDDQADSSGDEINSFCLLVSTSPQALAFIDQYAQRIKSGNPSFLSYSQGLFFLLCLVYRNDALYVRVLQQKYILAKKLIAGAGTEEVLMKQAEAFIGTLKLYQAPA